MANDMNSPQSLFPTPESRRLYDQAYSEGLRLWPVSFKEASVPTDFGSTHVIISGPTDAPPVVLFHPAGCGSIIWYRNVESLSRLFRVFAIDTVGEVNRTTVTRPPLTLTNMLDWVDQVFNGLGISRAHLIGNSYGGHLSALLAVYRPKRVKKVVLISPVSTVAQVWPFFLHFLPAYMIRSAGLWKRAYDWIWQGYPVDRCIQDMRMIASTCGTPKHLGPRVLRDDELARIDAPVLLLIGDHEVIYKPAAAMQRARRLIRGLQTRIVPDGNHNAQYTASPYVNQAVSEFLG